MKKEEYTCDWCNMVIDRDTRPEKFKLMAGGGELCILSYNGRMGHNGFHTDKHYHYGCFCEVVGLLSKEIKLPSELDAEEKCPYKFQYGLKNREAWLEGAKWMRDFVLAAVPLTDCR